MKLKLLAVCQSIAIVILLGVTACLGVALHRKSHTIPTVLTQDVPTPTESPSPDVERPPSNDRILLRDAAYGEIWLPVLAGVPACSREPAQLVSRNGMQFYLEEESITSVLGVDVSAYQGDIDWKTVKSAGIEFAMIRMGFRGYGSGELVEDEYFRQNMQGAIDAGIDVGVYFFSQAITAEEAVEEAEMVCAALEDYTITYPVVYDWEVITTDRARTDGISVDMLTDCTVAFCETVRSAGYTPMVYQNKRTSLLKLDLRALTDYDFWLAEYNDAPSFYYDYEMWQYTAEGSVPGIAGDVDLNICFRDYNKED